MQLFFCLGGWALWQELVCGYVCVGDGKCVCVCVSVCEGVTRYMTAKWVGVGETPPSANHYAHIKWNLIINTLKASNFMCTARKPIHQRAMKTYTNLTTLPATTETADWSVCKLRDGSEQIKCGRINGVKPPSVAGTGDNLSHLIHWATSNFPTKAHPSYSSRIDSLKYESDFNDRRDAFKNNLRSIDLLSRPGSWVTPMWF